MSIVSFSLIFFIILRIFSNPVANVFQKKLSDDNSCFVINFFSYLCLSLFCIPFCFDIFTSGYGINFWCLVILAGLLCSLGTACQIKAVSIGELSVIGPINSYKSVIGLLASLILLSEIPSLMGLVGLVLIIYGSKFFFDKEEGGFTFKLLKRKDIQLRFLSLLLTGIEAAILKKIILMSSVEHSFILWCFVGCFWSLIFSLFAKKQIRITSFVKIKDIVIIALCLGLMQYSTNFVFERMNVGFALSLFQLSSIVTVFFGYKIFKEQNLWRKVIGSVIMIIGSILIILS